MIDGNMIALNRHEMEEEEQDRINDMIEDTLTKFYQKKFSEVKEEIISYVYDEAKEFLSDRNEENESLLYDEIEEFIKDNF